MKTASKKYAMGGNIATRSASERMLPSVGREVPAIGGGTMNSKTGVATLSDGTVIRPVTVTPPAPAPASTSEVIPPQTREVMPPSARPPIRTTPGRAGISRQYATGGKVSSASSRGDGCAQRGKTKGKYL